MNRNQVHNILSPRGDLISLRRRMLGMNQTELSASSHISQAHISKIEQGIKEPNEEQLSKLANALKCPVSFFYQSDREYGPPMSAHPSFRKQASVGQRSLDKVIADFNVKLSQVRTLLRFADLEPELPLPQYDSDEYSPENIAAMVRRAWYTPKGPIKNLTEYAERAGCIVFHVDMEAVKIDGASYRVAGMPPVIFLNKYQPADRMRFTLAHEIGHLVMHKYPSIEMEAEADQFASSLLMPKEDISASLSDLTIEKAAYMKPVWKVSMAALIYRAKTLNKIDHYKSDYLWRRMSKLGYRTREPYELDFPNEKPSVITALIENLIDGMSYSDSELEQVFHLFSSEIRESYGLYKPGPRLVG